MSVFRAYFKVLRAAWPSMLINLCVFLALSVMFSLVAGPAQDRGFSQTKTPIAIINRDGDTPLVEGLIAHLSETTRPADYPDDPERLQDALFYRNVEYVLIIPEGFSAAFAAGGRPLLQKVVLPDSMSRHYVDRRIDSYLKTFRIYQTYGRTESPVELVKSVRHDLALQTPVSMLGSKSAAPEGYTYYLLYLVYVLLALVILGVTTTMISFNEPDLRRRNLCAPLPVRRMTLQLALGHATVALGCWAVLIALGLALFGRSLLASGVFGLFCLNSLAYTAVCASIGLLVGSFIKDHDAQAGASNVITLGMSFLSGAFVPQSLLSPAVLKFSRFLPAFWYVKAGNAIAALPHSAVGDLTPIYGDILIQLAFAAAFFAVTLLLGKERKAA